MPDTTEAGLLRSIAEEFDDDLVRQVFADWLEEHGDTARAEFVRVQCELARAGLADDRRRVLRVRECELLDAHRQRWCEEVGSPLEAVSFERGLISGARLLRWDGGETFEPGRAPRLTALVELDLSGLRLGDEELAAFARRADLPALRKHILSGNDITDAGAAAGLPRLDSVYLFGNSVGEGGQLALERSPGFRLSNLDLGKPADGYCMSPGQTDLARREYVRNDLLPLVQQNFATYELSRSAMLCVAQYWDDEARDAVHGTLVVSEWPDPILEGVGWRAENDPNIPNTRIKSDYGETSSGLDIFDTGWDDNNRAVPQWAAFAPEYGHQEYTELSEVYAPAVIFHRHGGYEFLPMCRPHLDGVTPEWGREE